MFCLRIIVFVKIFLLNKVNLNLLLVLIHVHHEKILPNNYYYSISLIVQQHQNHYQNLLLYMFLFYKS